MADHRTDEELMLAYQAGDAQSFDELYRRHAGRVYAYLAKRVSSREQADDLFQAVFLKIHKSRDRYRREFQVTQWFFVIAKTALIDFMRAQGRSASTDSLDPSDDIADERQSERQEAASRGPDTSELLERLPPEQRRVLEMRTREDFSYEKIAKQLGRTEVSVRQIYSRAVRKLRALAGGPTTEGKP